MSKCAACGKFVSTSDGVKCNKCSSLFEKACVQLNKSSKVPPSWICPGCVSKQPRKDNTETPLKGVPITSPTEGRNSCVRTNPDTELSHEMSLIRLELGAVRQEMAQFTNKVDSMLTLLHAVNERLTGVESRVSIMEEGICQRFDEIEHRVTSLEARDGIGTSNSEDVHELTRTVELLKLELNDRDQESLSTDVEITGLPEVNGENALHLVQLVASKLAIQLEVRDVVSAERVGSSRTTADQGGPRPLAVKLVRRELRDDLLRAARVRRTADTDGFGLPGAPRRFYVNERLTRLNRRLFGKARQLGKNKSWKFVWTRGGRIYARRQRDTEAHRIRTEKDILKVFGTD